MTTLYVFSATGNSLTTAQSLAERLPDCRVVPVPSLHHGSKVIEPADQVGFVFPVYYGSMPFPVRALVQKMVFAGNAHVFIVTTCRGHAGAVADRMDQLLHTRGQKLALALNVFMPGNSFINAPEVDAAHLTAQSERIDGLIAPIRAREEHTFGGDLHPLTPVDYPNNFRGIMADDTCIGCGKCVAVCPMDNIRLINGHAKVGDDCATCLACFHWCPQEAIWMSRQEGIERRSKYHHPEVTYGDILTQKKER